MLIDLANLMKMYALIIGFITNNLRPLRKIGSCLRLHRKGDTCRLRLYRPDPVTYNDDVCCAPLSGPLRWTTFQSLISIGQPHKRR